MMLPATREINSYLNSLQKVQLVKESYSIVSVIGGLSFLHAINLNLKKLILIDKEPDCCDYANRIIYIIKNSDNIQEFINYISSIQYDKRFIINFKYEKRSLDINHCNWLLGFGSFKNNSTFLELRESLRNADIQILNKDFINVMPDIKQAFNGNEYKYILASNVDCCIYGNENGQIIKEFMKLPFSLKLIAWGMEKTLIPNNNHLDAVMKIRPLVKGRDVKEIPTYLGFSFSKIELQCKGYEIFSPERNSTAYREDTLLYHISNDPNLSKNEKLNKLKEFIGYAYRFKRVIFFNWLNFMSLEETLKVFIDNEFHLLFDVYSIQWTGGQTGRDRSIIIAWERPINFL